MISFFLIVTRQCDLSYGQGNHMKGTFKITNIYNLRKVKRTRSDWSILSHLPVVHAPFVHSRQVLALHSWQIE